MPAPRPSIGAGRRAAEIPVRAGRRRASVIGNHPARRQRANDNPRHPNVVAGRQSSCHPGRGRAAARRNRRRVRPRADRHVPEALRVVPGLEDVCVHPGRERLDRGCRWHRRAPGDDVRARRRDGGELVARRTLDRDAPGHGTVGRRARWQRPAPDRRAGWIQLSPPRLVSRRLAPRRAGVGDSIRTTSRAARGRRSSS